MQTPKTAVLYHSRARFAFPANLAIWAIARVSQSYQGHQQKIHQFRALSLDLDKRLYTLLRTKSGNKVSIASCEGWVQLRMILGAYQRTWLQQETREAKLVYRKRNKTFYPQVGIRFAVQTVLGTDQYGWIWALNACFWRPMAFQMAEVRLPISGTGFISIVQCQNGKALPRRRGSFNG